MIIFNNDLVGWRGSHSQELENRGICDHIYYEQMPGSWHRRSGAWTSTQSRWLGCSCPGSRLLVLGYRVFDYYWWWCMCLFWVLFMWNASGRRCWKYDRLSSFLSWLVALIWTPTPPYFYPVI